MLQKTTIDTRCPWTGLLFCISGGPWLKKTETPAPVRTSFQERPRTGSLWWFWFSWDAETLSMGLMNMGYTYTFLYIYMYIIYIYTFWYTGYENENEWDWDIHEYSINFIWLSVIGSIMPTKHCAQRWNRIQSNGQSNEEPSESILYETLRGRAGVIRLQVIWYGLSLAVAWFH